MSGINLDTNSVLSSLSIDKKTAEEPKSNELGQDAFFKLMIAQLNNQNPLEPQANSEFIAQLAQFSSVEGIQNLNTTVGDLAGSLQSNQALQASALVGRNVILANNYAPLSPGENITGQIELPFSTSQLTLNIYNSANELVDQQLFGTASSGEVNFSWDGRDSTGDLLAEGSYRFEALANNDGKTESVTTLLPANVNSVTVGANNTFVLNVEGVGQVGLSEVKEIL